MERHGTLLPFFLVRMVPQGGRHRGGEGIQSDGLDRMVPDGQGVRRTHLQQP